MMKKRSITGIVSLLAFMLSFVGNAAAYTVFPSQKNETLQEWEFTSDYFKSGAPEANVWGDSYGNKNVWGAYYANSEGTYDAKYSAALGIPQMYLGDLTNNRGSLTYFYFNNPEESTNLPYLELGKGYSFYLTWTSPIDGVVKLDMKGLSRWAKTYPTYFAVYNNDKELGELSYSATGENAGKSVTKILKVSKGDTVSAKVYLDDQNPNGAVLTMKMSQVRTAIMNDDEYNKSWNAVSDYISLGKPKASEWGDSYGNTKVWSMSYYDLNKEEEQAAVFKVWNSPTTWVNPFYPNEKWDEACRLYPHNGILFYGETRAPELGAQVRVNWTAQEEGTVVAKLYGECAWGNGTDGVKFTIMKNGVALKSEIVVGKGKSTDIEQKIDVQQGDVVSFAAQTATMTQPNSEGYRLGAAVEARHGVQITEDPTFTFEDAEGNAASAPAEGGSMVVSLPLYNANTSEIGANVFVALYGSNNELIGVEKIDCGKIPGDTEYKAVSEKIKIEKLPSKASVYVWDSEVGMKPYYDGSTKAF